MMLAGAELDDVLSDDDAWFLRDFAPADVSAHDPIARGAKAVADDGTEQPYADTGTYLPLNPTTPATKPAAAPKQGGISALATAGTVVALVAISAAIYLAVRR